MHAKDEIYMKKFIQTSEGAIWNTSIKIMTYYSACGYELVLCDSGQGPIAVGCEHGW